MQEGIESGNVTEICRRHGIAETLYFRWKDELVGWAYLMSVIDCCTPEIVGWNLSRRCRTKDALITVEQAVLVQFPAGSRDANLTLTADNGTQLPSYRFL